jgi:tetratricopeptide (TPR) repeat protein
MVSKDDALRMMNRALVIIVLITSLSTKTFACLNGENRVLKHGYLIYEDHEGNVPFGHDFYVTVEEVERELKILDSLYTSTHDLDYLTDKGLFLILSGQYQKAIDFYLQLETLAPNRYSTASNIGTAYELVGQNENALEWINRAVAIDPSSHNNSEWIHVRILEAKINGDNYITSQHLLNTDFGLDAVPTSKSSKDELNVLHNALYFQLNERMSFVKPQDKIVAQLLFDLGNIAYLLGNYSDASADYRFAKDYGLTGQLIDGRIQKAETPVKIVKEEMKKTYIFEISLGLIGILIFLGIAVYILKRNSVI